MLEYLEANGGTLLFAVMVGTFALAIVWEELLPRRVVSRESIKRWPGNIALSLTNIIFTRWLDAALAVGTVWWVSQYGSGLLSAEGFNFAAALVITFLVYELIGYSVHILLHRVGWMWRVHAAHHSDTELDFSSTYRHHPFEHVLMSAAGMPFALLLGPPVAALVIYHSCRMIANILSHSNIYLTPGVDRWLRFLVVTPDFHRGHHSADRKYTNSNYGALLTVFDHLFGTATERPFDEHNSMKIGLEYFRERRDSRMDQLLLIPFKSPPSRGVDR